MGNIDIYYFDDYHRYDRCHFYLKGVEMNKKFFGNAGEKLAASYLESIGHRILERSFRAKTGEIDIISFDGECIHFVEVKTRSGSGFGKPREAVTQDKLRHIKNTAKVYIKLIKSRENELPNEFSNCTYSIDVMEVLVNHIEGVI